MFEIKVKILDFDNCIALDPKTGVGSEETKDQAWYPTFSNYPEDELTPVLEKVKKEITGGKGDRKDVARAILTHFAWPMATLEEEIARRCQTFDDVIQEGIRRGVKIPQAVINNLRRLAGEHPMYLNTATPRETIIQTLDFFGLNFFRGIYGRPGTKVENLEKIIAVEKVSPGEMLYVADAVSDYEAAQAVGCEFIGVYTKRNTLWHKENQPFRILNSLAELE